MTRIGLVVLGLALSAQTVAAQDRHQHGADAPKSMRDEHEEIQWSLQDAMKQPGAVGVAARDLHRLLEPHFVREEQIALPPLGVLRRLVEMQDVSQMQWILPITDAMQKELPRMLEEHVAISQARLALEKTARAEKNDKVLAFTNDLARHAQTEEEVSYPTAVLVGEIVRGRLPSHGARSSAR